MKNNIERKKIRRTRKSLYLQLQRHRGNTIFAELEFSHDTELGETQLKPLISMAEHVCPSGIQCSLVRCDISISTGWWIVNKSRYCNCAVNDVLLDYLSRTPLYCGDYIELGLLRLQVIDPDQQGRDLTEQSLQGSYHLP